MLCCADFGMADGFADEGDHGEPSNMPFMQEPEEDDSSSQARTPTCDVDTQLLLRACTHHFSMLSTYSSVLICTFLQVSNRRVSLSEVAMNQLLGRAGAAVDSGLAWAGASHWRYRTRAAVKPAPTADEPQAQPAKAPSK